MTRIPKRSSFASCIDRVESPASSRANALFSADASLAQNQDVKLRWIVLCVLCASCLFAQKKRFSWQNACFKNPTAPYCMGHEDAIKHPKHPKEQPDRGSVVNQTGSPGSQSGAPSVIVVGAINWRFADSNAETLAGFNVSKLLESPWARRLIAEVAADQGLDEPEILKIFDRLSNVNHVGLSLRGDQVVLMVTGGVADLAFPELDPGWKSVRAGASAMLIGHAQAVDQSLFRISAQSALGDLASIAEQRQAAAEFWAVGSDAPAVDALLKWSAASGDSSVDDQESRLKEIVSSPIGQRLGMLVKAAGKLPGRDAKPDRTRPVIYGLDGGPREVKQ